MVPHRRRDDRRRDALEARSHSRLPVAEGAEAAQSEDGESRDHARKEAQVMNHLAHRKAHEPRRSNPSWDELWAGYDKGLIECWKRGREMQLKSPDLAQRARAGELPLLVWKGGVETKRVAGPKYGSLAYLAMWQGLRGDDLEIDLEGERSIVCTRFGQQVVFTAQHYVE